MGVWTAIIAAVPLALGAAAARAAPLPAGVAQVIDAAADDTEMLKTVAKAARRAYPASSAEIDAQVAALTAKVEAAKIEEAKEDFFAGWKAKGEVGGSISTGNSDDQGFSASIALDRKTPLWVHDLNISVDHKREDGDTTKDRYFGAYSLQRILSPRVYAVGVLWGERDRFAGYNFRFSESLGLGYRLFDTPDLKLRIEAGPALRQAEYLVDGRENTLAARAAGYLTWKMASGVEFSQSLVTYLESRNPTLLASTALTTRLSERFSARGSYEVRHEADPPADREKTDTTTRLTLIFDF
jgi:putative salt-induced outer membrane protein